MAISVISVSSDSSEESVGTSTRRVILFGIIPTTIPDATPSVTSPTTHIDTTPIPTISPAIPPSPDYTPASLNYSPASDTEFDSYEDPSSDHIPPLPATSPFLSSIDDTSDNDIPDTPPSPTHNTPFTKTTLSTQRSPAASSALYTKEYHSECEREQISPMNIGRRKLLITACEPDDFNKCFEMKMCPNEILIDLIASETRLVHFDNVVSSVTMRQVTVEKKPNGWEGLCNASLVHDVIIKSAINLYSTAIY
ncbi:hypothetical protein Tco_0914691 [Tanacetum coccineum]